MGLCLVVLHLGSFFLKDLLLTVHFLMTLRLVGLLVVLLAVAEVEVEVLLLRGP